VFGGALATTGRASSRGSYAPMGSIDVGGAAEAVVDESGEVVYLATGDGFVTADVSDPSSPTLLAEVTGIGEEFSDGPLGSILDVAVAGDRLLVSGPARPGLFSGLIVYDVSDPANPVPATAFARTGHATHNTDFDGEYAYLTNNRPADRPLSIYDVTATNEGGERVPAEVGRWSPLQYDAAVAGWDDVAQFPGTIHDVTVHDGVAYCCYWDGGTWMVDVSDPTAPSYVGRVGDYPLERLVELATQLAEGDSAEFRRLFREAPGNDHYATVNDDASVLAVGGEAWDDPSTAGGGPAGVDLYDVSDPATPEQLATIEPEDAPDTTRGGTWTTAHNFDVHGDRLYTSWYDAGVKVHDISDPANPERLAWWLQPEEARFWTAQVATPGETFVASSYGIDGRRSALYVFPDREGEQADRPSLLGEQGTTTVRTTTTRSTTETTTATETTTPTTTESGSESEAEETPGFGALAALGGLGYGAYRYLRRGEE
jgi:hypothetical protein